MEVTHEQLVQALQTYFGFDTFKGNQEAIIRNVMEGNDTFVVIIYFIVIRIFYILLHGQDCFSTEIASDIVFS